MERQLKTISKNGIAEALAKVQHYRYLNEAEEAESICRDILAADPENQMALRQLGLALTDQFKAHFLTASAKPRAALRGFPALTSVLIIRVSCMNGGPRRSCAPATRRTH